VEPNPAWEEAVLAFCRALYSHRPFLDDFEPFVNELVVAGDRITLGMLALKLTAPGVPDIYQGDELPLRALVDPDNRRPVDWKWHQAMLSRLQGGSPPDRKTVKLWLTTRLLQLRIRRTHAFWEGGYEPLDAGEHAVAFLRGGEVLVVVATRAGVPEGACIRGAQGSWRDVLGGGTRTLSAEEPLNTLLGAHGVAVFEL
jgi:(1->4)-alpha-D-glucan 1-alpha-D-glucosylmutase